MGPSKQLLCRYVIASARSLHAPLVIARSLTGAVDLARSAARGDGNNHGVGYVAAWRQQ